MRSTVVFGLVIGSFALAIGACENSNPGPVAVNGSGGIVGNTTSFDACRTGGAAALPALRCAAPATSARIALALCGDLAADNTLTMDAAGSNLAVSGGTSTSSPLVVGGDFESAETISANNTQSIAGSLRGGADWKTSSPVNVGGDALLAGNLDATNTVSVTGKLQAASIPDQNSNVTAGEIIQSSAAFTSLLDCGSRPDVGALVASVVADPTITAVFPSDSLAKVDAPTDVSVACGPYVLTAIDVGSPLTIHVLDAATIVVRGNLTIAAPLVIDVAPGAHFDLVVGGDVSVNNTLTISGGGAASTWLAVGGTLTVASPLALDGSLLVSANVAANNTVDVTGAAYLGGLHVAAPLAVHAGSAPGPAYAGNGCFVGL